MINAISRFPKYNVSFYGNRTYVIGHTNPDSDSVCSAIGQAYLENQLKTDSEKEYQPIAAGDINAETAYALAAFGIQPPKIKKDVSLTVKQAMDKKPLKDISIKKNASIRDFIDLIIDKDLKTAPVLNNDGTIAGIVSRKSLAEFLIHPVDHFKKLKELDVPYERIVRLTNSQVLTGSLSLQDTIKGDILTGAYSNETMEQIDLEESIVIVGDREEIQKTAIKNGAKALIVTHNSPVSSDVIELAKENNVIILTTDLGHSKVTSMLEQAIPISEIMSETVIDFDANETVNDVTSVVKNNKFGFFPVTEKGKFIGVISREQILAPNNNGIILVDHNNPCQFAKGIDKDDIEGIVDHHVQQLVLDSARVPITYMPVGATATLVARNYKVNGVEIPKDIAGILWCAIVSDTDKFTSITTTPEDRKIANELAKIAGIKEQEVLANKLLAQRDATIEKLTAQELLKSDLKTLKTHTGEEFNISQIKTYQSEKYIRRREELENALNELDSTNKTDGSVLMITDLSQGSTYLLVSDKIKAKAENVLSSSKETFLNQQLYKSPNYHKNVLTELVNGKNPPRLINVQSRKEQIQPFISKLIELTNGEY